jgi:DNA polymerase III sliding clamp (beta) subunit (PCNA family)
MELVVGKNQLLRELQLFQGIVERKNTIPILANVLIEANGNEVRMLATDLEVALRSRCDAAVSKGGSLTLPAKKLYEIIKALGRSHSGRQERRESRRRQIRFAHADTAARGFPVAAGDHRRRKRNAAA